MSATVKIYLYQIKDLNCTFLKSKDSSQLCIDLANLAF